MSAAMPRPVIWSTACAWLVLAVLGFCAGMSSCSPRTSAPDASIIADVATDAGFDAGGDGLDSAEVLGTDGGDSGAVDVADSAGLDLEVGLDAGDAITDSVVGDADAAIDTAAPCSSTDIPAPLTGTVEFDFSPLEPNKVVMGCGKGPPQPVKQGAPCCKCAPPYSCYCNGECGWLRAPDLAKPQNNGQAVWTGKWVVSLAESYKLYEEPSTMHVQRWQPGSGKGFELVPLPKPWLPLGKPVALLLGKKVVLASRLWSAGAGYTPEYPAYLYDPETNVFTLIKMPECFKLVAAGGTLVCVQAGDGSIKPVDTGIMYILDLTTMAWTKAPEPTAVAPPGWMYLSGNKTVGSEKTVYFLGDVHGYGGPWANGSATGVDMPKHLLKFDLANNLWTDLGSVSPQYLQDVNFIAVDHVGIVVARHTLKAARFRLDTLKWEDAPSAPYIPHGNQQLQLTPCGLLFGSGEWNGVARNGGMTHRPLLLRDDLTWKFLPPWGYPDEYTTARKLANVVLTDKELYMLGGMNGPPDGGFMFHKDSYRYPLSALCD